MFERLVYQSTATHPFGSLHLFNLLIEARKKNKQLDITGHLLYCDMTFTQCIEGPPASIQTLWNSLQKDDRHHNLELLSRHPIAERRFPDWSMAFSSYHSLNGYNMPHFFPLDDAGLSEASKLCTA